MNCEKCQELLSDFLEGSLTDQDRGALTVHLEKCLSCAGVRNDLGSIVSSCKEYRAYSFSPPNETALWLRIRNMIESENGVMAVATAAATTPRHHAVAPSRATRRNDGWWSRLMGQSWELSLPQVAMAVSLIVAVVALATVFGVRRVQSVSSTPLTASSGNGATTRNVLTDAKFLVDGRVQQQQTAIQYWNQRVEQRKARWSPQMREAFERNMGVIDQAVNDSREQLVQNPHDEISEEMLNAALTDKMELLKEFSDQ